MEHFSYLDSKKQEEVFFKKPENFSKKSPKEILEISLGATLYMPATKENIAEKILDNKILGLASVVFCLEDAIGDNQLETAEENLLKNLEKIKIKGEKDKLPLLFIRVRNPEHLISLGNKFKDNLDIITGFSLPKFNSKNAKKYLENILEMSQKEKLYAMPILETIDVIDKSSRYNELFKLLEIFLEYKSLILNIRIGATDLSGLYGLRRSFDTTIYNIEVIRNFLGDVINIFKKCDFVISGVVWEYFNIRKINNRILKPQLRQTPFTQNMGKKGLEYRKHLLEDYTDTLLEEIVMDKVNGFMGKTVIHPSHIIPVQSMYSVTHEEYTDAKEIVVKNNGESGVFKSDYSNKMNEVKPHLRWAVEIMKRAKVYGVLNKNENYTKLLL